MDPDRARIEALLGTDLDQLLVILGHADADHEGLFLSRRTHASEGMATLDRLAGPLRQAICVKWGYCARRATENFSDAVVLVAAVGDVISTVVGGLPAATIATILVKRGLNTWCECPEEVDR